MCMCETCSLFEGLARLIVLAFSTWFYRSRILGLGWGGGGGGGGAVKYD